MRNYVILLFLLCILIPQTALSYTDIAWFTDASIIEGSKLSTPLDAPPTDPNGTKSSCVDLTSFSGVTFAVPSMSDTKRGMIGFWLRPTEDGLLAEGGSEHILLKAGDPQTNGLQISWDNSKGVLRFVMVGKNGTAVKTTVCRADISRWKAQDWHHVQVAWLDMDGNTEPVGLAIWIDKVAEVSCIFGGTAFMTAPSGNNITLGDITSKCYLDELIFHNDVVMLNSGDSISSATTLATLDYLRTAPYTAIQITHTPNMVNSDPWVLVDKQKQFGLIGTRLLNTSTGATTTEYLTSYDKRGGWSDYDAKRFITWQSSDTTYATIYGDGLVTGNIATTSQITITANFAGLQDTYSLDVKSWDTKPDLCLEYVERTPRYNMYDYKKWPDPGETVTSIAHIGNFGTAPASNFKVRIEKATDANNNFKLDAGETWTTLNETTIISLAEGEETTISQTWEWPTDGLTTGSVFIKVTLDSDGTIDEICEANNQRCEKNNAQAMIWGRPTESTGDYNSFADDYNNRVINLVGSFSDYDWCNAETDRVSMMLPYAVLPTTTPEGIQDAIRVDMYCDLEGGIEQYIDYYDGYWPKMEPFNGAANMDYDCAIGHEIGHTVLGLPDLYGQCTDTDCMFLKDPSGNRYAATSVYPVTRPWENMAMYSSAIFDHTDEVGVGWDVLMSGNNPWLDRMCAGLIQYHRQARKGLYEYWGNFGDWIPTTNRLKFADVNDAPLANARVYIYQLINTSEWYVFGNRYYPDRPKFVGATDSSGYWTIPTTTCEYWDDWNTYEVDGAVPASTPFAVVYGNASTVPSGATGEVLLMKVVGANGQVEFKVLPQTEFNAAYFSGFTDTATYPIQTSLTSPESTPEIDEPLDPPGGEPPTACIKHNDNFYYTNCDIIALAGTVITLDGSASYDPEGQPLTFMWDGSFGRSTEPIYTIDTSWYGAGDYEIRLGVYDSVCFSGRITIVLRLRDGGLVTGQVTDTDGNPVADAIVGIKPEKMATADADYYTITDENGYYTSIASTKGNCYIAAWKEGYTPTPDAVVSCSGDPVTVNLTLPGPAGKNLSIAEEGRGVAAAASISNENEPPEGAIDDYMYSRWAKDGTNGPEYWLIDLDTTTGTEQPISGVTIYSDWGIFGEYTVEYTIDDPLDSLAVWTSVYTTSTGNGGYNTGRDPTLTVNPILFEAPVLARGIRVNGTCPNGGITIWEIKVHSTTKELVTMVSGTVYCPNGSTSVPGAVVGIKTGASATADPSLYVTTDDNGRYGPVPVRAGWYVAAWKEGYTPTADSTVPSGGGFVTVDLTLPTPAGKNLSLAETGRTVSVWADSEGGWGEGIMATMAADGDMYTRWGSAGDVQDSTWYVDLDTSGKTHSVNAVTIYWEWSRTNNFSVDYTTGNPTDPMTTWTTAYEANGGDPGYNLGGSHFVDPIRFTAPVEARAVRLHCRSLWNSSINSAWEIQVYESPGAISIDKIALAKMLTNGTDVEVTGKHIIALSGCGIPADTAYIEEIDRSSGIMLDLSLLTQPNVELTNIVNVKGTIGVTPDGEMCIEAVEINSAFGDAMICPLGMNNRALGGATFHAQAGAWDWRWVRNSSNQLEYQFLELAGQNNIGMLVTVCGKVTQVDPSGQYFYIDDGANLDDGTKTGDTPNVGTRVVTGGATYEEGQFLVITGISSCFKHTDGKLRRLLRVRGEDDIRVISAH